MKKLITILSAVALLSASAMPVSAQIDVSEALSRFTSYESRISAAIENKDIDFLLSDTFQKEIPSLVETIKSAPTYDISGKADNWDNYKNNATSILSGISGKAPGPREYIPRLKYYVEHAEASATEQTKAFWLDRAS